MNLISKLIKKLKNIKESTKKRIIATALAGGIALSGLGMAGCNTPKDPSNTPPPIVNPGAPDYSKYSQILQNVLEDENYYYQSKINSALSDPEFAYNNPLYQPIPYGFLEDQGYDVNKYKYKHLYSLAELYSVENDLFVELKVEVNASTNYLNCYLLKYSLTDQELSEMKKLFKEFNSNYGDTTYFQAPFFVQEMSYLKSPEILSLAYTTKSTNDGAIAYFNKKQFLAKTHRALYLGSEYVENSQTAYHYYQIRPKTYPASCLTKMGIIKIHTAAYGRLQLNGLEIHNYGTELEIDGKISTQNRENFEAGIKTVTSFTTSNHYFEDLETNGDFENVLGQ